MCAACVAALGCSRDADTDGEPSQGRAEALSEWSIRIFAGPADNRQMLKLAPPRHYVAKKAGGAGAGSDGKRAMSGGGGVRPMAYVGAGDGRYEYGMYDESAEPLPDEPDAFLMLWAAGTECGMTGDGEGNPFVAYQVPVVPPWHGNSRSALPWYIFQKVPETCSEVLAFQETLLCIAQKLSNTADLLYPEQWDGPAKAISRPLDFPGGPYVIPPQRAQDKFILRLMAQNVIAHIVLLDMIVPFGKQNTFQDVCATQYRRIYKLANMPDMNCEGVLVFDGDNPEMNPYIYNTNEGPEAIEQAALTHMLVEAHVLRAAARLSKYITEKSVFADLAGAEERRAAETDLLRGSKVAWGIPRDSELPYNTLAAAVRSLAGRLEMGPYSPDPACGGVPAWNILQGAYGQSVSARSTDRPATTAGQERAAALIEANGIIFPQHILNEEPISSIRGAIETQLLINTAAKQGIESTDPEFATFVDSGHGNAVKAMIANVADGDLHFALGRTLAQYRVLVSADETIDFSQPRAGLQFAADIGGVGALDGTVLAGGLPKEDMQSDIVALAAGVMGASQCSIAEEDIGADSETGTVFQDAFSLGQSLNRRLVVLREEAGMLPESDAWRVANAAAAEVSAWAGQGRVYAVTGVGQSTHAIEVVAVALLGIDRKLITVGGVPDPAAQIALVYGQTWVADCAIGERTSCPDDFEQNYVVTSDMPPQFLEWTARDSGFDGESILMLFPQPSKPAFNPVVIGDGTSNRHLFVILRSDPDRPSRGRVLAALELRHGGLLTSAPISPVLNKLMFDVIGINGTLISGHSNGKSSLSDSPSYCIENVPRDMFVPLESELTSDSDQYENSWRHYLNLARSAAERADQLADKMVDIGLQRDLRREAAGEALAQLCGGYGVLDDISIEKGKVVAGKDDQRLKDCFAEEPVDIVFLTEDQVISKGLSVHTDVLRCESGNNNVLCEKDELEVSHGGLNLVRSERPEQKNAEICELAISSMESMRDRYDPSPLDYIVTHKWMKKDQIHRLVRSIAMESGIDLWQVRHSGEVIMNAAPNPIKWPGCYRAPFDCTNADLSVEVFDRIFRKNPGPLGGPGITEIEELAEIRWRVEGALWTLAAMAGLVPSGMFKANVPVANFTAAPYLVAPIPTIYGYGEFETDPIAHVLRLGPLDTAQDRYGLGDVKAFEAGHWSHQSIPLWLRTIDAQPLDYLEVWQGNHEVSLSNYEDLPKFIREVGNGLKGASCEYESALQLEGGAAKGWYFDSYKRLADLRAGRSWVEGDHQGSRSTTLCTRPSSADALVKDLAGYDEYGLGGVKVNFSLFDTWESCSDCKGGFKEVGEKDPSRVIYDYPNSSLIDGYLESMIKSGHRMLYREDTSYWDNHPCRVSHVGGVMSIGRQCVADDWDSNRGNGKSVAYRYTHRMLRPTWCPPARRVPAFVNSYPPRGICGAVSQLSQAVVLACELNVNGLFEPPVSMPTITELEDIPALRRWTAYQGVRAAQVVSKLYLESVPPRVIKDINENRVGTGSTDGEHGRVVLSMGNSIRQIVSNWQRVSTSLSQLALALDSLNNALTAAQIQNSIESKQLALQRLSVHQEIISTTSSILSGFGGNMSEVSALGNSILIRNIDLSVAKLGILSSLAGDKEMQYANQMVTAFTDFESQALVLYAEMENALRDIQIAVANTLSEASLLRQNQARANYEAAKGAGADYVVIDRKKVMLPVNTVLNAQYDITKQRYQKALHEAKYLAYVARLAIEQRIGMRMNSMVESVGPLEAPAIWADDVCSLQGIDYEKLRTRADDSVASGGGSLWGALAFSLVKTALPDYSDLYIGDYVAKLGNFVDYYNIQYPSHDGDDTAVLSLREDFIPSSGACLRDTNLLYFSDQLNASGSYVFSDDEGEPIEPEARGWFWGPCGFEERCLSAYSGDTLPEPDPSEPTNAKMPPEDDGAGGVTWLHEYDLSGSFDPESDTTSPRVIWQAVSLEPGTYLLSWRDQARADTGEITLPSAYSSTLRAGLYDESWMPVQLKAVTPHSWDPSLGVDSALWSDRRSMEVTVATPGVYYVTFGISFMAEPPGSVAIANVQFERISASGSAPTAYVQTHLTRGDTASSCEKLSPEEFRAAFRYKQDAASEAWYYELEIPIIINTSTLGTAASALNGKLASGNFNFRHITVALNLVGTGIRDCAEGSGMGCYGSGFLEYSLNHDAFQTSIVGYDNSAQSFSFGSAAINHGKCLATERYITYPIGSADSAMLAQPGIEKVELRGRPLDGSYRLRIWDDGSLKWNQLEDVQLVFKYRYWSRIDREL